MRIRNNFYYWASVVFLGFIYFLVSLMYKREFFSNWNVDITTVFQVVGTLGGAFLGAFFAGRYNTKQVTRQLIHQNNTMELEKIEKHNRYIAITLLELEGIADDLRSFRERIESEMTYEQLYFEIDVTLPGIQKSLVEIKSLNLINVSKSEIYLKVYGCIKRTEGSEEVLKIFLNSKIDNDTIVKPEHITYLKRNINKSISYLDKMLPEMYKESEEDRVSERKLRLQVSVI